MIRYRYGEGFLNLSFVKTAGQIAEASSARESECRNSYETRLDVLRPLIGDVPLEDVLTAAEVAGMCVTNETLAKTMEQARLYSVERKLAREYGFIAAQLRSEPDQGRVLTLSRPDMSLFEPYDARRVADSLPRDVVTSERRALDPRGPSWPEIVGQREQQPLVNTVAAYVAATKGASGVGGAA